MLNILGLSPWDDASVHSRRFRNFMLIDNYLLRSRTISQEANDLIRDTLRFHPQLRLSIPEISFRVLHIRSFFSNPRTRSSKLELRKMESTCKHMLVRLDLIAQRRKELEYTRRMDKTSVFNDLNGRLPFQKPPFSLRRICVCNSPQDPHGGVRPYCAPISGIPPPATICLE